MNRKIVAVTLYRRPDYTKQMLDALRQCFGIEEYTVLFACDWNKEFQRECDNVVRIAELWDASKREVLVHRPRLGVDESKLSVMPKAFEMSEFVIALEDDIVPAKDFLLYMEHFAKWGRNKINVLSICAYNRHLELDARALHRVWADKCFHTWGWGMWRDRWERFFGDNARAYRAWAGDKVNGLFDHYLGAMAKEHNLYTIKPCIARAQNIGLERGEHSTAETFAKDHNPRGAWELDLSPVPIEWVFTGTARDLGESF